MPTIRLMHLTEERLSSLIFNPVAPTQHMLDTYGHFTDEWEPNAIEDVTLAFCTHFNPKIGCWHVRLPKRNG